MRLSWGCGRRLPIPARAGITITGARLLGYKRIDAARLSMLMSFPQSCRGWLGRALFTIGQKSSVPLGDILLAVLFSAVAALPALSLMMRWLKRVSLRLMSFIGDPGPWITRLYYFNDCVIAVRTPD